MRLAFLDESGRSRREPIIVVAGVIIHGDRAYRAIEDHLIAITRRYIPEADEYGFAFHATDLFHGSRYFDRKRWSKESRWAILQELTQIPRRFSLPIVYASVDKANYREKVINMIIPPEDRGEELLTERAEHMKAFANAEVRIEQQMHRYPRDEICALICEDTDLVKTAVKQAHTVLRGKNTADRILANFFGWTKEPWFPITKIVDTPHFAAKSDSRLLQIADVCAFTIMRRLNRKEDSQ